MDSKIGGHGLCHVFERGGGTEGHTMNLCYLNRIDNPSATSRNKYGDKGSPCRKPQDGANESEMAPLNFIEYFTEVTHDIIQSTHR